MEAHPGAWQGGGKIAVSLRPLLPGRFLDARPQSAAEALPIAAAVNIPADELPQRTHELPPRERTVAIADTGPAAEAAAWLQSNGRRAELRSDWNYAGSVGEQCVRRLWEPAAFLAEVVARLAPGRVLDLACGSGRDAVFLAAGGWSVSAVDRLPDALGLARDLEDRCKGAIARPIQWVRGDLETPDIGLRPPFELSGGFDLIVIIRFLHRPLMRRVADWLRPGGSVVCETFTTLHRARHGKPAGTEHVLRPGELPALLGGLEITRFDEGWRGEIHTARVWATRY
ncbi:tellurite resistance protein TehB [Phycisphaerae bacterium RAS1]|nr:tellurite resistance protein TehB [Phycisphaerae bacterium RAS1]